MKFISVKDDNSVSIRPYLDNFLAKYFEYGELCLRDNSGRIVEDPDVVYEFYKLKHELSVEYTEVDLLKYICIYATNRLIDNIESLRKENLSCLNFPS